MSLRQRQLVINDCVDLNRAAFSLRQHADVVFSLYTTAAGKFTHYMLRNSIGRHGPAVQSATLLLRNAQRKIHGREQQQDH
jgi:hypothetical protein